MQPKNRGGRAAAAALLLLAFGGALPRAAHSQVPTTPAPAAPQTGVRVDTVLVRGNLRLTEAQVRGAGGIHSGSYITPTQVPAAINRLMNTGQFETVDVLFRPAAADRGAIILQVRERPILGDVTFQGLKSVSGGTVRDSAKLKAGEPLNPQRVRDAEKLVRDLLAKKGVQLTSIDTTLRPMPNPAQGVRLTFNVREGGRLAITAGSSPSGSRGSWFPAPFRNSSSSSPTSTTAFNPDKSPRTRSSSARRSPSVRQRRTPASSKMCPSSPRRY